MYCRLTTLINSPTLYQLSYQGRQRLIYLPTLLPPNLPVRVDEDMSIDAFHHAPAELASSSQHRSPILGAISLATFGKLESGPFRFAYRGSIAPLPRASRHRKRFVPLRDGLIDLGAVDDELEWIEFLVLLHQFEVGQPARSIQLGTVRR